MKWLMLRTFLKEKGYKAIKDHEERLVKELTNDVFSEWNDDLEQFARLCERHGYDCFRFFGDGRIVMEISALENGDCQWKGVITSFSHLEYLSLDDMLQDWQGILAWKIRRNNALEKSKLM